MGTEHKQTHSNSVQSNISCDHCATEENMERTSMPSHIQSTGAVLKGKCSRKNVIKKNIM